MDRPSVVLGVDILVVVLEPWRDNLAGILQILNGAGAHEQHRITDLFSEQVNDLVHAFFTTGHRSVEIRAPDDDKVSAESKSSNDIGSGTSRLSPR